MTDNSQRLGAPPFPSGYRASGVLLHVTSLLKSPPAKGSDVAWSLMRLAWSSVAALAIASLQDVLNLGPEARMNVPGRALGNWAWRCSEEMLRSPALQSLLELTSSANRLFPRPTPQAGGVVEAAS